jgi:peptidylprolyl isomerase
MSNRASTSSGGHGRAVMGALAGVALVVVLAIVFFVVKSSTGKKDDASSAAAPASAAASAPAAPDTPIDPALQSPPKVTKGAGDVKELKVTPIVEGKGPKVTAGQQLTVNYTGVTYKDGKEFDSSWKNGQPVTFPVGTGQLIKGWDQGLVGVPVGSRVQLDIPAELAYGEKTTGGQPAGDLRFVVDILKAS